MQKVNIWIWYEVLRVKTFSPICFFLFTWNTRDRNKVGGDTTASVWLLSALMSINLCIEIKTELNFFVVMSETLWGLSNCFSSHCFPHRQFSRKQPKPAQHNQSIVLGLHTNTVFLLTPTWQILHLCADFRLMCKPFVWEKLYVLCEFRKMLCTWCFSSPVHHCDSAHHYSLKTK